MRQTIALFAFALFALKAFQSARDLNRNGKLDDYEDWRMSPPNAQRRLMFRTTRPTRFSYTDTH